MFKKLHASPFDEFLTKVGHCGMKKWWALLYNTRPLKKSGYPL